MPIGQKKPKRQFKPKKKEAQVEAKTEPEPEFIEPATASRKQKKGPPEKKQRVFKQREIIQTKSVFTSDGVERRGYGGKTGSGFGGGGGGSGGGGGGVRRFIGEDFQARAPIVNKEYKVWTKEEIKEEQEQAEKALKKLMLEDKMIQYDRKLFSEKDFMPVQVGYPLKDISKIRKEESNESEAVDDDFLRALKNGDSGDQIFLFQMSDLPIVPKSAGDADDYDPNEELHLGDLSVQEIFDDFGKVSLNVGDMKMKVVPGSDPRCFTELSRMTASSYQVVGEVSKKYTITPDFEHLLGRMNKSESAFDEEENDHDQIMADTDRASQESEGPPPLIRIKSEPQF